MHRRAMTRAVRRFRNANRWALGSRLSAWLAHRGSWALRRAEDRRMPNHGTATANRNLVDPVTWRRHLACHHGTAAMRRSDDAILVLNAGASSITLSVFAERAGVDKP